MPDRRSFTPIRISGRPPCLRSAAGDAPIATSASPSMRPVHLRPCLALLLGAAVLACTPLAKKTQKHHLSGFLGDYSQFRYREDRGGILAWERRGVRWIEYQRLMIDQPVIYLHPEAGGIEGDRERFEELATAFHQRLLAAVKDSYPVVDQPGPDVLRIRCAITNVMTTERARALRDQEDFEVPVDIGGASIEGEFLDSISGARLLAFVDTRSEARPGGVGVYARWEDARKAFDDWARRFRGWLDYQHGLTNLPPPVN
jgi:hypothetical protein